MTGTTLTAGVAKVSVAVADTSGNTVTATATVNAATGAWAIDNFDISALSGNNQTFTMYSIDANNNSTLLLTAGGDGDSGAQGTAKPGATVTFTITDLSGDSVSGSTTANADTGAWAVTGLNISGFTGNPSYTVNVAGVGNATITMSK